MPKKENLLLVNNLALGFNTRKQLKQKVVQKSTETIESSCKGLVHANTKICKKNYYAGTL